MSTFLDFPVYGGRITSGYGWRIHPVSKDLAFHTGLDIGESSSAGKLVAAIAVFHTKPHSVRVL